MTDIVDWEKAAAMLDKKDQECEVLKKHCIAFLDRQVKDTKIIVKQGKEIETLRKNQDPVKIKAYNEVYARVMARKSSEELLTRIAELNKT